MKTFISLTALAVVLPFVLCQDDCSVSYISRSKKCSDRDGSDWHTAIDSSPAAVATAASNSSAVSVLLTTPAAVATTLSVSVSASSSSALSNAPTQTATNDAVAGAYATTSGTRFTIDGQTGYFAGTNTYWIGFLTNNADVDTVMQHLSSSGLKVLRVWGFNDVTSTPSSGTVYYQSFAGGEPTINTGANGLQRLDYVVKSAEGKLLNADCTLGLADSCHCQRTE